jgi:hypothetical protein
MAVTSEADSDPLLTYRQVGQLLGVGERAALNWVREQNIPITVGRPARVRRSDVVAQAAALDRPLADTSEALPHTSEDFRIHAPSTSEAPRSTEPIEAAYRVTPTEIEQAVSRTSAQYMGDLRTMLAEVGKVYESQLLAKDQTITTQADMLALQTETIAELRRRAEVAEAEVLRQRQEQEATQAAPAGAWAQEAPMLAQEHTAGAWGRLRRWWGS